MTPEEFRAAAHDLVDWIADRRLNLEAQRVRPDVAPGDIADALPDAASEPAESIDALMADFEGTVVPGITEVQHPMHFGWFPSNATLSAVLGDIATAGLGSLGISWESSPALTEVEEVTVDWMRQLLGLSDGWKGVIQDTASTTCLVAMLAARERATDHAQASTGVLGFGKRLTVYSTGEAHSSVRKAALLAGFASDDLRWIDVDPWTRDMQPDALAARIEQDVAEGAVPAIVVATCGSTGTTAFDPVPAVAEVCATHGIWLHIDAAMAGVAMMLPEQRHRFDGVERADSISLNPHKWLGTSLDCSLMYLRDPDHLIRVMSTNPSYLRTTVEGEREPTQYRDWGIPLGRRFRALKLWYQLRLDDLEETRDRLRRDIANAEWLATQLEAMPDWDVVAPVRLQTVCFRHRSSDLDDSVLSEHNLAIAQRINASGEAFLSPSILDDQWMLRVSVGVEATERRHLERLLELLQNAANPA
ncbi:MAG: pyridoxal-dependent decarboxylase [Actinomycetota bacterium]